MEWTEVWLTISNCWISFLLTLMIYWLQNGRLLASFVAFVLAVVELDSLTRDLGHPTPAASFVIAAVWYNQVSSFMRQCMETITRTNQVITSGSITGTSVSHSFCSWSPKSLMTKCWLLRKSFVMARTPLSTKIQSEQYSDL